MKRILKIAALALVVLAGSLPLTASAQYTDDGYAVNDGYNDGYSDNDGYGDRDVDYQTFYDELSPHGRWVDYPGRGYVWIPNAGPDFRPYSSNGHWVYSEDYEWMWVSDYDWGWAPFHYGRWDNDPSYGWYWVPGYEWSPAWVAWRDGGDYYGWAPIRPGINISINFNIGGYAPPVDFWCFAPRRYITYPRIYDYCVPYRQNTTIINHTTIIVNNYRYGGNYGFRSGPRRYDAERYTGRINPVRFRQSNTPGRSTFRNNEVSIFRPTINRTNNSNRVSAPRNFERYDRNNAGGFRNNNVATRNNNTPGRVGSNDNNRFERRTDPNRVEGRTTNPRQPQTNGNNNNPGNRRFERTGDNTPKPNTERRVNTPTRNPNQPNSPVDNRRFERRTENNGNTNNPSREPRVRSNENNPQRQQQMERRVEPRPQQQQQQRQFERRQESPRSVGTQPQPQQRQIERRQQPQQQQQRQFERKDNGSSNRQQGSGNSGNGRGKNRF